ncbi:MAG: NUDIX hydrolase [Erysipelotrichaceae bacterium]
MKQLTQIIKNYPAQLAQEQVDKANMLVYLENQSDLLDRTNTLAHFSASSWIVNQERTKVLMVYHNQYNSWSWCGGHNDGDADPLAVSYKEACEETGLTSLTLLDPHPISLEILPVWGHIKKGNWVSSHMHLNLTYLFEADEHAPLTINPDENAGVKWVEVHDVLSLVSEEQMKSIYTKLMAKAQQY